MNEHEIDRTLNDAGARLRAGAPDPIATRQALLAARERPPAPSTPRRNWWPTAIGIGLAGAAAIGVLAYNAGDPDDTIEIVPAGPSTAPAPTVPVTTIEPSVVEPEVPEQTLVPLTTLGPEVSVPTVDGVVTGDAAVVTTADGRCLELRFAAVSAVTAGCTDGLDPARPYFTASGGQVYVLTEAAREADGQRVVTADVIAADDALLCGLPPSQLVGRVVYTVSCNRGGDVPVALAARLPLEPDAPATYFTTPYEFAADGVEFGAPALTNEELGLVVLRGTGSDTSPNIVCLDVVDITSTDAGRWRETCRAATEAPPTGLITMFDDVVVQVDVHADGEVTLDVLDRWVPPSSGCSHATAKELMTTSLVDVSPTLIFGALRCGADRAATTAGSVLFQPGPPDGLTTVHELADGAWVLRDSGTGIDEFPPHRNPSYATWSAWPGETAPYEPPYIAPADPSIPTLDIGATLTNPAPSVDALAAAIVEHIDGLAPDPEFPANARLVAVEPGGLPLIVAEADVGGDDSVRGEVVYVWFEPVFDQETITGYRIETTYVNQLCWRGGGPDSPLCV